MLEVKKMEKNICINDSDIVSVKKMGNIIDVVCTSKTNYACTIKKIDKDYYVDLTSGEVKEYKHNQSRIDNKKEVSQSIKRLRDYINYNVTDVNKALWVTLTYKENMTDTEILQKDYEKFVKKFRYHFKDFKIEYIVACEPQSRGAWHCHVIFLFDKKRPYIPNKVIEELWGNGFTKTTKLVNVDNIGAYLSAYLGDIELNEIEKVQDTSKVRELLNMGVKNVSEIEGKKLRTPKKFIKGGRLIFYPVGFHMYRISSGIKKVESTKMTYLELKKEIDFAKPIYEKSVSLEDTDKNFKNLVKYEQYNLSR